MPSEDQVIKTMQDSLRTRYIKYELLGSGACKKVYKAFDEERGMEVAWNQVCVGEFVWSNEKERGRVFAEIRVLKQLKHKNIISMHDWWYDPHEATLNFITELFTDGTLRQYRRKHKHLETTVIKRWAWQMLQGLVYLHGHNPPIIHRDLKADNIFVNGSSGTIKIGDLGFATLHQVTVAMSVIGTPEFMAPELYEEQYSEKVDVYSYGMCLLELATMQYPYSECKNAAQIYKKVSKGMPPEGLAAVSDPEMAAFIRLCIGHDPAKRPEARCLLKHPFFDCVKNAQQATSVPRPVASVPPASSEAGARLPSANGSACHPSASTQDGGVPSSSSACVTTPNGLQSAQDCSPPAATAAASAAASQGNSPQPPAAASAAQQQQQEQAAAATAAEFACAAAAAADSPSSEPPGLVIACILPAVVAGRADVAAAGRADGPTPAQVALTSFALAPRPPSSRIGHSRSSERRFSELSEADLLFDNEHSGGERTSAGVMHQQYHERYSGGGIDPGGGCRNDGVPEPLAWHGSFERCSSPDMTSPHNVATERRRSAASYCLPITGAGGTSRPSFGRSQGGTFSSTSSGSWKRDSGGGASDKRGEDLSHVGGEEERYGDGGDGGGSDSRPSSLGCGSVPGEDEFASFSRHLRNNHVSLACRGRTERLLSFSMSFTNDSGHRKRIGFQYDEDCDTAYDVALEMVEVLALDVEAAHVVADRIQQEIQRYHTSEAAGGSGWSSGGGGVDAAAAAAAGSPLSSQQSVVTSVLGFSPRGASPPPSPRSAPSAAQREDLLSEGHGADHGH